MRPLASGAGAACLLLALGALPAHAADPVIAAAGDIACAPTGTPNADPNFNGANPAFCQQRDTSDLLVNTGLTQVLALGDTQYATGTAAEFQGSYDPSWGRVKSITRPAIGNHEYEVGPNGETPTEGYFDYFNGVGEDDGPAGERGRGYYSFDVGSWHLVALNSQCNRVPGGCEVGSPQEQWLRQDLADNPAACTLAYWHHPQFYSGPNEIRRDTTAFWQALHDAGADLILNGHRHAYERFAPQDPQGNADSQYGLREFIVGTGGHSHADAEGTPKPNSVVRDRTRFGVLRLVLHPNSYDWTFVNEDGTTFDPGSVTCHGPPDDTPPQTTITAGPTGTTSATSATFSFSSSETGSTFACRLDGEGWAGCASPSTRSGIASGSHSFEVRATDVAANTDPTPAVWSWSVQREAPPSPASELFEALRPTSYEILKGDVYRRRGGLRRLYRNDGKRLELLAGPKRSGGYRSVFQVLTVLDPDQLAPVSGLELDFNGGTSRRRARFIVRVFNYRAREWVKVFGPRKGRRDRSFDWSVSAFADDYLSRSGAFRTRVKAKGRNPFRTRTDLVRLTVEY
jgi:acid phosphatase type 7